MQHLSTILWLTRRLLARCGAYLLVFVAGAALFVQANAKIGDRPRRPARPRLILPETERDFGIVEPGERLAATFMLTNAGERRLVVRRDTCECTLENSSDATIQVAPGESAEITAAMDTSGRQGPTRHVERWTTSDPRIPKFAIVLTADVQASARGNLAGQAGADRGPPPGR